MTKTIQQQTTGVILAGGQGTRMGGKDKGLVVFAGKPLVEHVMETLIPQVQQLFINANRSVEAYQSYGYPVVGDNFSGFQGPLAGIEAALNFSETLYLATVPCDSPKLPADYVMRMGEQLLRAQSELVVASDGQRMHPVFCLINVSLLDSLRFQIESGERKIDRWFEKINYSVCDFSDQRDAFYNINTEQELTIG